MSNKILPYHICKWNQLTHSYYVSLLSDCTILNGSPFDNCTEKTIWQAEQKLVANKNNNR